MSITSKRKQVDLPAVRFRFAERQPHTTGTLELFPHQRALFDHLTGAITDEHDGGVSVITSMTGSGKTIANILPAVDARRNALLVYPTNALVADQHRSITRDADAFAFDDAVAIHRLTARSLQQRRQQTDESIPDLLFQQLRDAQYDRERTHLFLSNPDTLYNIVTGKYWNSDEFSGPMDTAQSLLLGALEYIVLDEFHMYSMPATVSLLNLAALIRHVTSPDLRLPLVFSSATSEPQLERWLSDIANGPFRTYTDEPARDPNGDYTVAGPISLELLFGRKWEAPTVFMDRWTERLEAAAAGNGAAVTAIFESVKRTLGLCDQLREEYSGIESVLAYNTGVAQSFDPPLADAQVRIGTRTLSVGVDFDIQSLFFEAYRARDFLQKLGRVGRRGGQADATGYTTEYALPDVSQLQAVYDTRAQFEADLLDLMTQRDRLTGYGDRYGHTEFERMRAEFGLTVAPSVSIPWSGSGRSDLREPAAESLLAFRNPGTPQVAVPSEEGISFRNLVRFLELHALEDLTSQGAFLRAYRERDPVGAHYIETGTIQPVLFFDTEPSIAPTSGLSFETVRHTSPEPGLYQHPAETDFELTLSGEGIPRQVQRAVTRRLQETALVVGVLTPQQGDCVDNESPHLFRTYDLQVGDAATYRLTFGQNALAARALLQNHRAGDAE